jgi:hypothetical protein
LSDRYHQLFGVLGGEPVICSSKAPAGAPASVLEASTPVGALQMPTVSFDADRPKEVNAPFPRTRLAVVCAISRVHEVLSYANPW